MNSSGWGLWLHNIFGGAECPIFTSQTYLHCAIGKTPIPILHYHHRCCAHNFLAIFWPTCISLFEFTKVETWKSRSQECLASIDCQYFDLARRSPTFYGLRGKSWSSLSTSAIHGMFDNITLEWAPQESDAAIPVPEDVTRLTLTLTFCFIG